MAVWMHEILHAGGPPRSVWMSQTFRSHCDNVVNNLAVLNAIEHCQAVCKLTFQYDQEK